MIKARIKSHCDNCNLGPYGKAVQEFSWDELAAELTRDPQGRVNIVRDAVDRWAQDESGRDRTALIVERAGEIHRYSFLDLMELSCQWANLLVELGYQKGDRLFIFLAPCAQTFLAMLACARLGVIFCNLHTSLSYEGLEANLQNGRPRGVLTHPDLSELLPAEALEEVEHVLLIEPPAGSLEAKQVLVAELLKHQPKRFDTLWLDPGDPLYIIYTSGSTGPPKGVVHAHGDMLGHLATARYVLDLNPGDVLWTDGHPGWVTGTVYASFAPWLCGAASVVQGDPFSASNWYRTLERHRVQVWYTSPMIIRRLMEAGEDLPGRYDFSRLTHIASVGEPLTPELFFWVRNNLKLPPHDTWWMSETGMITIANYPGMDIKLSSIGRPFPGVEAAVVDEAGRRLPLLTMGELAVRPGWPAMMTGLWNDPRRYQEYFHPQGWFLTGDMAVQDEEGYFFLQGRNDDLIKTGDKFIGPFEVESVLARHPAVREAAVISKGGEDGTILKAFIAVARGFLPSSRLKHEIRAYVRANLSPEIPFKEVEFLDELPKTSSGKLLRRALRALELGLPSGDTKRLQEEGD